MEFLIYPLSGVLAGLLAGVFGIGGGLVVVPVLVSVFAWQQLAPGYTMQLALGTSLATIVVTATSSTLAHHRRDGVAWPVFRRLTPGVLIGTWLGAGLADRVASAQLQFGFGLAECALGLYMAFKSARPAMISTDESRAGSGLAGGVIGAASSLGGIGGGTLTVPYLVGRGMQAQRAVGTAAACGLPIAVSGSLSYLYWGWGRAGLPALASGYLYWPAVLGIVLGSVAFAPLGAALAHRLPAAWLKRGFALLLLGMGAKMLVF